MKMTIESHVNAPPDEVFAAYTNLAEAAEHVSGIESVEMLTDGPVGVGTRFREKRIMFKKEAIEEMEFTAFDPPTGFTLEADSCGAHFTSAHRFAAKDGGTLVSLHISTKANTFGAKLFTPLGLLFNGMMRKAIQRDMDDLKLYIERRNAAPVA